MMRHSKIRAPRQNGRVSLLARLAMPMQRASFVGHLLPFPDEAGRAARERAGQKLHLAARPAYLDLVRLCRRSQAERHAAVAGGEIGGAAAHLLHLRPVADGDEEPRADSVSIALRALKQEPYPAVAAMIVVAQEGGLAAVRQDQDVRAAVVIVVAIGRAAPHAPRRQRRTALR